MKSIIDRIYPNGIIIKNNADNENSTKFIANSDNKSKVLPKLNL